jgi:hypothetical protein
VALRSPPLPSTYFRVLGDIRVPFLLVPFLWASKEKELARGARPAFKQVGRDSGLFILLDRFHTTKVKVLYADRAIHSGRNISECRLACKNVQDGLNNQCR